MGNAQHTNGLKILAADEDEQTLAQTDGILAQLGHTVTAHALSVAQAGDAIAREDPDLSVVVVGDHDDHALELIEQIGEYARGPVITLIAGHDPNFIDRAVERGVYAFARTRVREEVQGAIDLALRRHEEKARLAAQVEQLESAIGRRAMIERAKGILMERHGLDEQGAFELLREQARSSNRRVVDIASAVAASRALLPREGTVPAAD